MEIPVTRYVALYGSMSGDWRTVAGDALQAAGLAFFDPTQADWSRIDPSNGDAQQALVDELVAREQRALAGAACVVYHLARRKVVGGRPTGETTLALASRCELGFMMGRGIRTFAHVEGDVEGRNYLWAAMKPYPWMTRCGSLEEATAGAIAFMSSTRA